MIAAPPLPECTKPPFNRTVSEMTGATRKSKDNVVNNFFMLLHSIGLRLNNSQIKISNWLNLRVIHVERQSTIY